MKFIRKYLFFTVYYLLFTTCCLRAQNNLVQNPSFEDTIICSSHVTNQLFASNWWMYNTVDYYRTPFTFCSNSGTAGTVPNNSGGYQYPHTDNSYIGIVTYLSATFKNYREWIQEKLSDTLINGKIYCVSFWYNEANRTKYAIDRMGIYFSLNGVNLAASSFIQYNPQITTPPGQFLNDTMNWNKFSTTYTATGNELYITLGNFFDSSNVNMQLFPNSASPAAYSYYLLDDISIIPTNLPAYAGRDTSTCANDSIYIGRPQEIGLDNIWTEIHSGTQVGTGAGIYIKSDTSATYVVTQNLCGTITYDTIRVTINCTEKVKDLLNNNSINIYPNPANEILTIEFVSIKQEAEISIVDILSNEIIKRKVKDKKEVVDISDIDSGVYFVKIFSIDNNLLEIKKVIVQH